MDLLTNYQLNKQLGLVENESQASCYNQEQLRMRILEAYRSHFKPLDEVPAPKSHQGSVRVTQHSTPTVTRSHSPSRRGDDSSETISRLKERISELEKSFSRIALERDQLLVQVKNLKAATEPSRVLERVVGTTASDSKLEIYKQQILALSAEIEILKKS